MKDLPFVALPESVRSLPIYGSCGWTPEWDVRALLHLFEHVPGDIVEIGCNNGQTTRHMAMHFPLRRVFAIDWVGDETTMVAPQRGEQPDPRRLCECARALPNVTVINQPSQTVSMTDHGMGNVRCVFIDGDHSRQGVRLDSEKWMAFLGSAFVTGTGIIVWHDVREDVPDWCQVLPYLRDELSATRHIYRIKDTWLAYWLNGRPNGDGQFGCKV